MMLEDRLPSTFEEFDLCITEDNEAGEAAAAATEVVEVVVEALADDGDDSDDDDFLGVEARTKTITQAHSRMAN